MESRQTSIRPRVRRMTSYTSVNDKDQRFAKMISAVSEHDLDQLLCVIDSEKLPVCYQEPGRGNRTALHYATKCNFTDGVRQLLKSGAKCNVTDDGGLSPLHIAAAQGAVDTCLELILAGAHIDALDKKNRTPLHWAVSSYCDVSRETLDKSIKITKLLLDRGAKPTIANKEKKLPIHLAAQAGFTEAINLLVARSGSGTISAKDEDSRTPLHHAVQSARSLECVILLLQKQACIDAIDKNGQTPLHILASRNVTFVDEEFDVACIEILLSHGASVHIADNEQMTPLDLALLRTMWWGRGSSRDFLLTFVRMLVVHGSRITCCFTMWRMIEAFPTLLLQTLNHSIKTNTSVDNSPHLVLDFDMRSLIASEKLASYCKQIGVSAPESHEVPSTLRQASDMSMLHYLVLTGNNYIISHPLCRTFLHLKWMKTRKYYVANFLLKGLFVLIFTGYVFQITNCGRDGNHQTMNDSSMENGSNAYTIINISNNTHNCNTYPEWSRENSFRHWIVLLAMYSVLLLRELIQFLISPLKYFACLKRFLSVSILVLIPVTVLIRCPCDDIWWAQIAAVTMIIAWISLLLSFSEFPSFGVYIVMFSTVARNVFKLLGFYILLLIAFMAGFHVLLHPYQTFNTFWISIPTTLVMMTGELDYATVFVEEGDKETAVMRISVLLLFIFLVYIILSNLLVGLAVSDMAAIRKRSELMRLTSQVMLMVKIENIINSKLLPNFIKSYLRRSLSLYRVCNSPVISVLPNKRGGWISRTHRLLSKIISVKIVDKIFESMFDNFISPSYEPELPEDIVKTSLSIALRQFEIEKKQKLFKTRCQTNFLPVTPMSAHKRVFQFQKDPFEDSFFDLHQESEDSSVFPESASDTTELISKNIKYLTLKKSSRKNIFAREESIRPSGFNTQDPVELLQTLRGMQDTLDQLIERVQESTGTRSRAQSVYSVHTGLEV